MFQTKNGVRLSCGYRIKFSTMKIVKQESRPSHGDYHNRNKNKKICMQITSVGDGIRTSRKSTVFTCKIFAHSRTLQNALISNICTLRESINGGQMMQVQ